NRFSRRREFRSGFLADLRADVRVPVLVWEAAAQSQPIVRLSAHVSYSYFHFTLADHVFEIACNQASLTAQKGVNAMYLGKYKQAIELIDKSLINYDPTLVRGRARLLAQKAEAYFKLGIIDACVLNLKEAYTLARSSGSSKVINKVKALYNNLTQSKWRKDWYVAEINQIGRASCRERVQTS